MRTSLKIMNEQKAAPIIMSVAEVSTKLFGFLNAKTNPDKAETIGKKTAKKIKKIIV